MTEVEISIGKSKYKIQCDATKKESLLKVANSLNEKVNQLSFAARHLDEKTLLVISALTIEEELQNILANQNNQISEREVFDAVSENMENVSDYLEGLVKKIHNS